MASEIEVLPAEPTDLRHPAERDWPRPWMGPFLRALSLIPEVTSAHRSAGVGHSTVYRHYEENPEFAAAWDEALLIARDNVIRVAHNWITTGVPVASRKTTTVTRTKTDSRNRVIETTTQTETVESESRERSAVLMIFWLKAFYPERFRWSERVEATGVNGGPVQIESLRNIDAQIVQLTAELAARSGGDPVPDE